MRPGSRRATLWAAWALVLFGLSNVLGPPAASLRRPGDPPTMSTAELQQREGAVASLFTTLRDDGDIARYFAYAQATLGRISDDPYLRPSGPDSRLLLQPPEARGRLVPWRDFVVEYPPGMMAAILIPAFLTGDYQVYLRLFLLETEIALTLAVWLAVRTADRWAAGAGDKALGYALCATLCLGIVAVRRYDPWVALSLAAGTYALTTRRYASAGVALALGIALKGSPLVAAPVFALYAASSEKGALTRFLGAGLATFGPCALLYLAIAGPHALDSFAYHAARPLQVETLYSGLIVLAHAAGFADADVIYSYGSHNIVSTLELPLRHLSTLSTILLILGVWIVAARQLATAVDDRRRALILVGASTAALVSYIVAGKVFSPQYCVWLLPLAATAAPFLNLSANTALLLAFALVQAEYPFLYDALFAHISVVGAAMSLLRAGLLAAYGIAALWTPRPDPPARQDRGESQRRRRMHHPEPTQRRDAVPRGSPRCCIQRAVGVQKRAVRVSQSSPSKVPSLSRRRKPVPSCPGGPDKRPHIAARSVD